jgi:glutamine amidotransferase
MCQLLGMNCNVPTDIVFSLTGFHRRGGATDEHCDGWGIAFYEGPGCRVFLDTRPAADSPVAGLVRDYPIRSLNVIAHIRKATIGSVSLQNTHPFVREMWGRHWTFAHNGTLSDYQSPLGTGPRRFTPVGTTDSEQAFCDLLETLWDAFPERQPDPVALQAKIEECCDRIARHGTLNLLLSNGELLFARCATRLAWLVRQSPFTRAHLVDADYEVDFSELTTPGDRVALIATAPLTDNEAWTLMPPGQLLMFRDGAPVRR